MTANPSQGELQAYVQPATDGTAVVVVKVFKFDSIRQEAYWVTKEVRKFANAAKAQAYVDRITK